MPDTAIAARFRPAAPPPPRRALAQAAAPRIPALRAACPQPTIQRRDACRRRVRRTKPRGSRRVHPRMRRARGARACASDAPARETAAARRRDRPAAPASRRSRLGPALRGRAATTELRRQPQPHSGDERDHQRNGGRVAQEHPLTTEDLAGVQLLEEGVAARSDVEHTSGREVYRRFCGSGIAEPHLHETIARPHIHAIDEACVQGAIGTHRAQCDFPETREWEGMLEGRDGGVGDVGHQPKSALVVQQDARDRDRGERHGEDDAEPQVRVECRASKVVPPALRPAGRGSWIGHRT